MCLSVPGKIIEIEGDIAKVSVGNTIVTAGLRLIDNAIVGEYVLVHSGFAIQRIDVNEAEETLRLINEIVEMDRKANEGEV